MSERGKFRTNTTFMASWLKSDTLVDSVMILLSITVVQRLVGFGRSVLACRWLAPEELGQWDLAFGFLVLAAPLAVLGLPGSFGRYAEHFRQRGHLRTFLRRTAVSTIVLVLVAVVVVLFSASRFSKWVFGNAEETRLVLLLAGCLLAVCCYYFLIELFTALRIYRVASTLQLGNTLLFAGASLALILGWQASATSMVIGYGTACFTASLLGLVLLRQMWGSLPPPTECVPQRDFWSKLLPFAAWVWVTNWLANLFAIADRYMLLHFSPAGPKAAVVEIGHYHSSRVVPVLLAMLAGLLASLVLPHLSRDWERGRRREVVTQLNLILKVSALAMAAAGGFVLLMAPLLFGVVFQGKYDSGLAVLPWTLTYCVWFGLTMIATVYLWCAEKARLGSAALALGLGVNIAFNLLLVPRLGLLGAVLATTAANFVTLVTTVAFCRLHGLRFEVSVVILSLLPLTFPLGAGAVACALAATALCGKRLFSVQEKRLLATAGEKYLRKIKARWNPPDAATA